MADDPVSIRTNNPGAQWFGPIARQFGAADYQSLPGGNNAAVFDNPVSGAAAQFALWGKNYTGMPLSAAISKWSGGNSSPAYMDFIQKQTGLSPDAVLTHEMLAGPQGVALAKAQARWEAGRDYPLTDNQWRTAQLRGLGTTNAAPVDDGGRTVPANIAGNLPAASQLAASAIAPASGGVSPDVSAAGVAQGIGAPSPTQNEAAALMQAQRFLGPQETPLKPAAPLEPAINRTRLRNALAGKGATGVPLPPSVRQRLAALMGRS